MVNSYKYARARYLFELFPMIKDEGRRRHKAAIKI